MQDIGIPVNKRSMMFAIVIAVCLVVIVTIQSSESVQHMLADSDVSDRNILYGANITDR